jgi:hypothetical protein
MKWVGEPSNSTLWKLRVPLKINFFEYLWKGVILTKDNLVKRKWHGSVKCCFCSSLETIQHLFFIVTSNYARALQREKILLPSLLSHPSHCPATPQLSVLAIIPSRHPNLVSSFTIVPHHRLPQPPCRLSTSSSPTMSLFPSCCLSLSHCCPRFTSSPSSISRMHTLTSSTVIFPCPWSHRLVHTTLTLCRHRSPFPRFLDRVIIPTAHAHL